MDGTLAIKHNHEALKRILASLVAMAGLTGGTTGPGTLRRHLYLAVLRLLRPAESAARRLIIAAARGLIVELPALRLCKPKARSIYVRDGVGTGIVLPRGMKLAVLAQARTAAPVASPPLSFPLLDPPCRSFHRRQALATSVPRISLPGYRDPFPVAERRSPQPNDLIDATRLARRLTALSHALDDLPRQALRFARWKARRDAGRVRRISPLRRGCPPRGRLSRYDPTAARRRTIRDVDEVLAHTHALALFALERRDTS